MAEVITMLALSPTMEEGTLVSWLKSEGDSVEEGELIAEIETDKATMEMESFHEGILLKLLVGKGDAIPVGAPLAIVGEAGESIDDLLAELKSGGGAAAPAPAATPAPAAAPAPAAQPVVQVVAAAPAAQPSSSGNGRVKASPLARRMAEDQGLDLRAIGGSGPHGRVIKRDVEQALKTGVARPSVASVAAAPQAVPLSQMRKTIAKRLGQVWQTTPHFYLSATIDMAATMTQRKAINAQLKASGSEVKLSVNDIIVKACGIALKRYPRMNVAFQGDHLVQYSEAHVGVAVAIEDGLITPVIRPEEYSDGTFTVSNLGMFGIDHFSAIINPPQAAILACGAVQQVPVVEDGALAIGTRMTVTLSCDHRAVDGAMGAEFLSELRALLENPLLMLV
jgi:pyruvate dehydrogenase E2 component (dihydrolipoamide acetyltransferase)